jgi:hypothetical protein
MATSLSVVAFMATNLSIVAFMATNLSFVKKCYFIYCFKEIMYRVSLNIITLHGKDTVTFESPCVYSENNVHNCFVVNQMLNVGTCLDNCA